MGLEFLDFELVKIEADHPISGTNSLVTQLEERRLSNWDVLRLMSNTSRRSRLQIISGPLQWIQYGCNCRAWCESDCDFGDETGGAWVEATPTCRRHQCWGIYNRYGKGVFFLTPKEKPAPFVKPKGIVNGALLLVRCLCMKKMGPF